MDATTYSALLRSRLAKSGETAAVSVAGSCMAPLFVDGMTIHLVSPTPKDPLIGEIYVFTHESRILSHRFLGYRGGKLLFKGDLALEDELVSEATAIIARVDGVVLGGRLVPFDALTGTLLRKILGLVLRVYAIAPRPLTSRLRGPVKRLLSRKY